MPKVTVCVPSYNYANYIGGCIRSVLEQTFENWELVVVDNRSSDNTSEVVRSFSDPRIRFFENDRNVGLVRNWNRSVSLARGEFVAILPADDAYLPRMLERSVAVLDAHPRMAFTHTGLHRIDERGVVVDTIQTWDRDLVMDSATVLRRLLMWCYVSPPTVVMRRACFENSGGFDETLSFAIDWAMWLRLALSYDVGYIAEPLAINRYQHSESVSARNLSRRPQLVTSEEVRILKSIFPKLPNTAEWHRIRRQAYKNLIERHLERTLRLLHQGDVETFRSELEYAARLHPAFPLKYRKMTALWFASSIGAHFAVWMDSKERQFWHAFQGRV